MNLDWKEQSVMKVLVFALILGFGMSQLALTSSCISTQQAAEQGDALAQFNLGTVYARQARWDEAIEEYRKALENPRYPLSDSAYYNLARALSQIEKYDEALIALRNASLVVPLAMPMVLIHQEFGRLYEKVGEIELARASYQEAIEADNQGTYREQLENYLRDLEVMFREEESPQL